MKKETKKKNIFVRIITSPITLNLVIMAAIGTILVAGTLYSIDRYTLHNESVLVPDVKKLQVEDAAKLFSNANLKYEVTDSIFLKGGTPGAIVEQIPYPNAHVKLGRTVFLTVQAKTAQMVMVPNLKDFSQRQAVAQLNSLGFNDVRIRQVPSQYTDLVVHVEYRGDTLRIGQKVPKGSTLGLVVGMGGIAIQPDSLDLGIPSDVDIEESFFN